MTNPFINARIARDAAFKATLENMDKWLHCAILLGFLATDSGADQKEVDQLIQADKTEIDRLLLERLKNDNA